MAAYTNPALKYKILFKVASLFGYKATVTTSPINNGITIYNPRVVITLTKYWK